MVDIAIPQVNFYSMLSGLGDTLQANAKLQQQQQVMSARKAAFSDFTALDPSSPDYGKQAITIAQKLGSSGDQDGAIKFLGLAQTAADRQRQAQRDAINDQHWSQSFGLQQSNAARAQANADREWNYDPTEERTQQAKDHGLDPNSPEGRNFILTGSLPAPKKPIQFETLGGSKFLVPDVGGNFKVVDPNALGQPQQAAPPVPSTPKVVGDAEGVANGLYAPPQSPGQRPPIQQPASFDARFQGQAAAPAGAAPQPPVDLTAIDPQTGRRENWLKAQPPEVQAYIKKIADYQIDPRTTSIRGGHREQVLSAVAQYDPTYDQNSFSSRAKAIRDFATGTQGNAVRSFDVATDHLDTLQKYVDALKNGDVRVMNTIRNQWLASTGSPLPTNVQAVAPIVGAEVSKAIIGSNNALADREELRKPLQNANSPEQLAGAIQAYKALMTGQLRGLKKQYEDTTGKKDFNNRLRENTKKVLLGNEGDGASSMLQQARDAIAQGAPKDAVVARLKAAGIDASDL